MKAYTDGYYKPTEALPRKILVQFDRSTGKYDMTFEETDEALERHPAQFQGTAQGAASEAGLTGSAR